MRFPISTLSRIPIVSSNVRGYPGASHLRDQIVQACTILEVEELFAQHREYIEKHSAAA